MKLGSCFFVELVTLIAPENQGQFVILSGVVAARMRSYHAVEGTLHHHPCADASGILPVDWQRLVMDLENSLMPQRGVGHGRGPSTPQGNPLCGLPCSAQDDKMKKLGPAPCGTWLLHPQIAQHLGIGLIHRQQLMAG
jgi:hypothetical protein